MMMIMMMMMMMMTMMIMITKMATRWMSDVQTDKLERFTNDIKGSVGGVRELGNLIRPDGVDDAP